MLLQQQDGLLLLFQPPLQGGDLFLLLQQLLLETVVALLQSLTERLEGGSKREKQKSKYLTVGTKDWRANRDKQQRESHR